MPKTLPPGTLEHGGRSFTLNVVPDVFDERDLEYRPRLSPLQPTVDVRPDDRHVMTQEGSSCTGHAVAAMINAVLAHTATPTRVSPYMLYRMARRYDEWQGEDDDGSSLRGALKGWYYHGVLPVEDWPDLDEDHEPDLDLDATLALRALERPLGAFYRVNAFRLDDVQSAVTELHGIVASAAIHSGWESPVLVRRGEAQLHVIERPVDATPLGGHAFAVVGYNEVGLLVQNSWGPTWGRGGFATLPYEDWLSSVHDAWVARPGVRTVVSLQERTKVVTGTGGRVAVGPGPDLVRLQRHVVNLGNDGRLSGTGRFRSSPRQLQSVLDRMRDYHERWPGPRRVVLYAHGGLNSERTGLAIADSQLNWWLNNRVYPVTFAWQSGPAETLLTHLGDVVRNRLPAGGPGLDLVEQVDRLVEKVARSHLRWMWREMKENAAAASRPLPGPVSWPGDGGSGRDLAGLPGASLTVDLLAGYAASLGGDLQVHLVGHSAGAVFLAGLLQELVRRAVPVAGMTYLAPAIRVEEFERLVLPHLQAGRLERLASFALSDRRELDDVCAAGGVAVYQKSLLYLVSRALEHGGDGRGGEVPLLGMQRFHHPARGSSSLAAALEATGRADLVESPSSRSPWSRTDATTHGGFDDDAATMTSVLLRVLDHRGEPTQRMGFVPHAPLLDPDAEGGAAAVPEQPLAVRDSRDAGQAPVTVMAAPQPSGVDVPPVDEGRLPEEVLAPRSTSPVMDALLRSGWRRADEVRPGIPSS